MVHSASKKFGLALCFNLEHWTSQPMIMPKVKTTYHTNTSASSPLKTPSYMILGLSTAIGLTSKTSTKERELTPNLPC